MPSARDPEPEPSSSAESELCFEHRRPEGGRSSFSCSLSIMAWQRASGESASQQQLWVGGQNGARGLRYNTLRGLAHRRGARPRRARR
eukprot:829447-Prymnesium_polylepis.3